MDVVTLVIAILGLVLAAVSGAWQVATWFWSSGRPRAALKHGVLSADGAAIIGPVKDQRPIPLDPIRAQGYGGPEVLAIEVTNFGRAPVTVTKYAVILVGSGVSYLPVGAALGPELPFRIQPGEGESWYTDMATVRRFVAAGQVLKDGAREICMEATLGTGRTIRTKQTIRI